MRYFVTVDERTFEVDLTGDTPWVDGVEVEAELARVPGTSLRHLLADGRSVPLFAAPAGRHRWDVVLAGERYEVEVVDERTRAIREMTGAGAGARGPSPVRAPMPGLVVRVSVEPGQVVEPGQTVATIEAMKMENELRADAGGRVARVGVEIGQAVEKGAVLVEFETDGAED